MTKFGMVAEVGEKHNLGVSHLPIPGPASSKKNFQTPMYAKMVLTFGMLTYVE